MTRKRNPLVYSIVDGVATIKLINGGRLTYVLVDEDILRKLEEQELSLFARKDGYVEVYKKAIGLRALLHRWIMEADSSKEIDHKNHVPSDNRRENLRAATREENCRNKAGAQTNSKSGVRGVHRHTNGKAWVAQFTFKGKIHHVGYFQDIEEAAQAIEAARAQYYGEFKGGN